MKRIHEDYEDPTATWSAQFGSIATERLIPVFKDFFKTLSPKAPGADVSRCESM